MRLSAAIASEAGPSGPASNSAFRGAGNTITGPSASGTTGRDGNFWRQAG